LRIESRLVVPRRLRTMPVTSFRLGCCGAVVVFFVGILVRRKGK